MLSLRNNIFIFGFLVFYLNSGAQVTQNLFTWYSFDDCTAQDNIGVYHGIPANIQQCVCGIKGQGAKFDGSQVIQMGDDNAGLHNTITSDEFTLALALHTAKSNGAMTVFSVTEDCDSYGFELVYNPSGSLFSLRVRSQTELIIIDFEDDAEACWQQVAINRLFNRIECFVNGEKKVSRQFTLNPDFTSLGFPKIGGGGCAGSAFSRFKGIIDEVKIYNRVLSAESAQLITGLKNNELSDHFQVIFTGQQYGVELLTECDGNTNWLPANGVDDPAASMVQLSPSVTTRYSVTHAYEGCTETDTILIKVLDESSINCNRLLLPNSFTPNNDGLNDTYGISTTYSIEGDCRFEIFNKYGGVVFTTTDANGRWDGTFGGTLAPSDVYMYKISYTCGGSKYNAAGSVNLIR